MTPHEDRLQARIDEMLADAGHGDDPALRSALESISSLALLPAPEPSGELAAMLAGPGDELARRRRSGRHRPTVIGLAVIAGMGLGIGGVAASAGVGAPGVSATSVQHMLGNWSPGWAITHVTESGQTFGSSRPAHGAGDPSDTSATADKLLPTTIPAGTPAGAGMGKESAAPVGPAGKPGCGNQSRSATTTLGGSCPPAAVPSGRNDRAGIEGYGYSPVNKAQPRTAATPEGPADRWPGITESGQPDPGAGQPRRATANGEVPGRAGTKPAAGPGTAKPRPGNSGQGEAGEGPNAAPAGK